MDDKKRAKTPSQFSSVCTEIRWLLGYFSTDSWKYSHFTKLLRSLVIDTCENELADQLSTNM